MGVVLATEAAGAAQGFGLAAAAAPALGSPVDWGWLIPVVPALSAALLLLAGRRFQRAAGGIAIAAVGISAVLSTLAFLQLRALPADERVLVRTLGTWLDVGALQVDWALLFDPLSSLLTLLVTWVGLLIHVYSLGYMHGDERYHRYFAYLNLFVASMLVLVLGESFLVVFVGWELVGLCSFLLIGFWFEQRSYAGAATKAFVVNRVGDVGFLLAMFVTFGAFGSLSFTQVLPAAGELATGTAVAITLLLFLAATGKSAQLPLFVWLPDAMAGPTPVSALIHAATMVTAGVFLIARTSPFFALVGDSVGIGVAWVGVATALIAALAACALNDLKRILAYSTISQLGYMIMGVGLGSQVAGIFHLLTHGFFKALLFLAAGSVMHALANRTDVWEMGGLRSVMPITFVTSLIAWASIAGVPPFSGFWSKEEVLVAALDTPQAQGIWVLGTVVAGLTAFYMSRWLFLVFFGRRRWPSSVHPHESPPSMTLPLVVLAVASALGGLLEFPPGEGFLHDWLATSTVPYAGDEGFIGHGLAQALVLLSGAIGIGLAVVRYLLPSADLEALSAKAHAPVGPSQWAAATFGIDRGYDVAVARPGRMLAEGLAWVDRRVVDGAVNGAGWMTQAVAQVGRRAQTGIVRSYALAVLLGTILVTAMFLGRALNGAG